LYSDYVFWNISKLYIREPKIKIESKIENFKFTRVQDEIMKIEE